MATFYDDIVNTMLYGGTALFITVGAYLGFRWISKIMNMFQHHDQANLLNQSSQTALDYLSKSQILTEAAKKSLQGATTTQPEGEKSSG